MKGRGGGGGGKEGGGGGGGGGRGGGGGGRFGCYQNPTRMMLEHHVGVWWL